MKQLVISGLLICLFALPAWAGKTVYLKDGGIIKAKSVWRAGGKVNVLVNRDTLADFNPEEINMKKTFKIPKHHLRKKTAKTRTIAPAIIDNNSGTAETINNRKKTLSFPSMPSLTNKSPSDLQGKEEGVIRKHKREMAEKAAE